jgi:hypothetical protein
MSQRFVQSTALAASDNRQMISPNRQMPRYAGEGFEPSNPCRMVSHIPYENIRNYPQPDQAVSATTATATATGNTDNNIIITTRSIHLHPSSLILSHDPIPQTPH